MSEKKKLFPAMRWIIMAAFAGVVAGTAAVYVSGADTGNMVDASSAPSSVADQQCRAKSELAQKVGAAAIGEVAAMLPAENPRSLANLSFNAPDGEVMRLGDLSGRTLLVNLWATWCAPCRAEMPALNELEKQRGSDKFQVVAVNVDNGEADKPKKFLEEIGVDALAQYRDPTLGIFTNLKKQALALGLPVTLLIDEDGCLLAHMNGPAEWASDDAKRFIDAALAK